MIMDGIVSAPLLMLGNVEPVSSGHCYRGLAIEESRRFQTLSNVLTDIRIDENSKLNQIDLEVVRTFLSTTRGGKSPILSWSGEMLRDPHVASSIGATIEIMLIEGSFQAYLLEQVIRDSCVSRHKLILQGPDPKVGRQPIPEPPADDDELAVGIAVQVEPWINLAEFLQTCEGVRLTATRRRVAEHKCDCEQHPERYVWRSNVSRLEPVARPFFGLYEGDPANMYEQPE